MNCKLCGTSALPIQEGFCPVCAATLRSLESGSGRLNPLPASGGDAPAKVPPASEAVASAGDFRVVLEFGQSAVCRLCNPRSLALEADGAVIVLDQPARDRYRFARFSSDGEYIETLLECPHGTGPAELRFPRGLAVDHQVQLYVADAGNHRLQVLDRTARRLRPLAPLDDDPAPFNYPCDVAIDRLGMLYITDSYNNRVQKRTPQGLLLAVLGLAEESATEDFLCEPSGVTIGLDGTVFVADTNHHRVAALTDDGPPRVFGGEGAALGRFSHPRDIRRTRAGLLCVADDGHRRLQRFHPDGRPLDEFRLAAAAPGDNGPGALAVDNEGLVLLVEPASQTVRKIELLKRT